MRDLENCCAHALIALNKRGEPLAVCSSTTALCGQHCGHGGSTSALVSSDLGQYIHLKGACSIHLSLSNPLGFCSMSLGPEQRKETLRCNSATEVCELSAGVHNSLRKSFTNAKKSQKPQT